MPSVHAPFDRITESKRLSNIHGSLSLANVRLTGCGHIHHQVTFEGCWGVGGLDFRPAPSVQLDVRRPNKRRACPK